MQDNRTNCSRRTFELDGMALNFLDASPAFMVSNWRATLFTQCCKLNGPMNTWMGVKMHTLAPKLGAHSIPFCNKR